MAARQAILAGRRAVAETEEVLDRLLKSEIEPALAMDSGFGNARYAPSGLVYKSVSGEEYLVEVPQARLQNQQRPLVLPADWRRISSTKAVARFRPASVERGLQQLNQRREQLQVAAADGWRSFQATVATEYYGVWAKLVGALGTLDCLLSLAALAQLPGYCRPTLLRPLEQPSGGAVRGGQLGPPPPVGLLVVAGRHPTVEALLPTGQSFVPNSIELGWSSGGTDSESAAAIIISGPNMGGKSSYLRQVALLVLMAQVGSFVPAERMELRGLFDGLYTRMGTAADSLVAGQSSFLVELQQTAAILERATRRSLVILDELGRGTATHDGTAIAAATLSHLCRLRIPTLFVTHYPLLCSMAEPESGELNQRPAGPAGGQPRQRLAAQNFHMSFIADASSNTSASAEADAGAAASTAVPQPVLTFLYKLTAGPARRSFGLNVGRLAELPPAVLATAASQARRLEEAVGRAGRKVLLARLVEAAESPAGPARQQMLADLQRGLLGHLGHGKAE